MRAFAEYMRCEWQAALRHPSSLLLSYLFPIGFFFVVGGIMPQLNPAFRGFMVPTFAVFALLAGGVLGLPTPHVEQRAAGVLRAFRVVGVPDSHVIAVPALSAVLHILFAATVISVLAVLIYRGDAPVHWLRYAAVLALAAFAFTGLGSLIGVVSASSRATTLWSQLIFLPSTLVGGLMIPLSALPPGVRPASALLPSTHIMQLFDVIAYGRPALIDPWWSALSLLACGAIAFALSAALYSTEQRDLTGRRGLWVLAAFVPFAATALFATSA